MTRSSAKERADQLVVAAGLAETRSHARALIMAGQILADGQRVDKAGQLMNPAVKLELKGKSGYVSRAGYKLEGALLDLNLDVTGCRVLDIGASTGGFTDCLLQKGAAGVVAVDVGYGIFHYSLRQDSRVTVLEKTNARYLTAAQAGDGFDLAVMDVSFISLTLVLPPVVPLLRPGGRILAMVKPQFEAGREKVGKGGVIRDAEVQAEAVEKVRMAGRELGLEPLAAVPARLKGPKGNQEHFLLFLKPDTAETA